jgi:hypothetical protein
MDSSHRRWEDDDRYVGVADASLFGPAVDELAELAHRPGWVAEEPGVHLLPHLRDANVAGLSVVGSGVGDAGILEVEAEHSPADSRRVIRRQAWALIGAIAELATCVRERQIGDALVFEVVTGMPADTGPFATHGHTVRLSVRPSRRPNEPRSAAGSP